MNTTPPNEFLNRTFELGTIGAEAQALVKKFGHYTAGLMILEMAFRHACQPNGGIAAVTVGGKSITNTPGFQAAKAREEEVWARLDAQHEMAALTTH